MAKAPAFQFYANDFMDATRMWDANACGLYIRCICIQWTHGSIPSDLKLLARALHCDRSELEEVWPVLKVKFEVGDDGCLRNRRLEEVRDRQSTVSSKRSKAANARWKVDANADANAMQKDMQRKVKVEGEVEREKEGGEKKKIATKVDRVAEEFDALWIIYERYGARGKALSYWRKLTGEDRESIMDVAPKYVASTPGCKYRKQLEGWINPANRLWERPIPIEAKPALGSHAATLKSADPSRRLTGEWA